MSRKIFYCLLVLALATVASSANAATKLIGSWNDSNDGYIDWASPQPSITDLPAKYSYSTTGVTDGSKSLKITAPIGWQQNLATRSYQSAYQSGWIQGFLDNPRIALDVTFVTADWVSSSTGDWAQVGLNIQGTNLSWESMGRPDLDSGNPGYPGGWDSRNFGAMQTRTMYWDISYLHDGNFDNKEITATPSSGYVNLIFETNAGGFSSGGVYYFDNLRFVPEPVTIMLLGLGGLFLRRRK
jgi:hypothetical protein